jgi:hypothetical protein
MSKRRKKRIYSTQEVHALAFGFCVAYRPPEYAGHWVIDENEDDSQLPPGAKGKVPAFYELAQEAIDRADFLTERGLEARALPLVARQSDFDGGGRGRKKNKA